MVVHVLRREAEFFIKHLVRSRETEAFQAEHLAVGTYQTLEVDGQTGGEAEYLGTGRQNLFLIARALTAEQAF